MKKMTWRTPGYAVADDSPVTQVTWNDCLVFCNWLSDQEKLKSCYRFDAKAGWALLASGQITMRKVDGWQSLAEKPSDQIIDLVA